MTAEEIAKQTLDALAALEKEATKGEWISGYNSDKAVLIVGANDDQTIHDFDHNDATFIAAIRNAAPFLIEVARKSRRLLEWGIPRDCDCDGEPDSDYFCSWHRRAHAVEKALARLEGVRK